MCKYCSRLVKITVRKKDTKLTIICRYEGSESKSKRGLVSEAFASFPNLGLRRTRVDILLTHVFFSDGDLNKSNITAIRYTHLIPRPYLKNGISVRSI